MTQRSHRRGGVDTRTISHSLWLTAVHAQFGQVRSVWSYDITAPLQVCVTFYAGDGAVPWTFGRDLLFHGLVQATGSGDVTIAPGEASVPRSTLITLRGPDDVTGVLSAATHQLESFLRATTELVPLGQETRYMDFDAELAALLAG